LAVVLGVEAVYLLFFRKVTSGLIPQPVESFGSPQEVGTVLFSQYLLPFEITSILLLIAMVGAIVLTKKEKGEQ
jgi:NADH-quinone oxidoreductase subunit J